MGLRNRSFEVRVLDWVSVAYFFMQTYKMFMGRDIPSGGYVSNQEWDEFCKSCIDTRFDGYTSQDVQGCWKGKHEDTKLVSITTEYDNLIKEVATLFRDTFKQDSVAIQTLPPMEFV